MCNGQEQQGSLGSVSLLAGGLGLVQSCKEQLNLASILTPEVSCGKAPWRSLDKVY